MPVHSQTSPTCRFVARVAVVLAVLASVAAVPSIALADTVFTVTGRGWGHGIGLSQYGAKGYAEQGWTYDKILNWYFKGTSLTGSKPMPIVKVDIDSGKDARSSWRITAGSASTTLTVVDLTDSLNSVEVTRGTNVWITFDGGDSLVRKDRYDSASGTYVPSTVLKRFPSSVIARTTGAYATSKVRVLSKSGPFDDSHGIVWRGFMRFVPNTTTGHAVNYVTMDHYVQGVVPRESPSGWHIEALKAQATAARSYAYGAALNGSVLWCTTMSQVYNGASCGDPSHNAHETARTNQAVADTANRVVVYGSSVVQTFFSSSSGGRTANSKDVWFSSRSDDDSPVYYTSVVDADTDSPNYRWTPADWTGTAIAGKLRGQDDGSNGTDTLDYSERSPATVTAVSLEKGTSGFVRYVTATWSNGARHTMKGTTFQSALRLKSSAFTVIRKTPPPTRYEQTDKRLSWSGPFATYDSTSLSGGSHVRTAVAGSSMTAMFKGSQVAWIGAIAPSFGKADVYLDGARQTTVSLYSSTWRYKRTIWSKSGLSGDTTHTLVLKVLGTRDAASSGKDVGVDAIDVLGTLVQAPPTLVWQRYQENAGVVAYSGSWTPRSTSLASGGRVVYSRSTSATATLTFTGNRVRWIGTRARAYGKALVSLDGGAPVSIDLYASTSRYQQTLWDSGAIAAGRHVLTIRPAGTRNASATDRYVAVDAFLVLRPATR